MKQGARKIRRLYHDTVLAGFAGSAADGFALFTRFEARLDEFHGNLERAAVELARDWRTDRALRRLEAYLLIASDKRSFVLSGTGTGATVTSPSPFSSHSSQARPWRSLLISEFRRGIAYRSVFRAPRPPLRRGF